MKSGYSINLSDNRILNETDFLTRIEKVIGFYQTKNVLNFFFGWIMFERKSIHVTIIRFDRTLIPNKNRVFL